MPNSQVFQALTAMCREHSIAIIGVPPRMEQLCPFTLAALGSAILRGLRIVLIVEPGTPLSRQLMAVADAIVADKSDPETLFARLWDTVEGMVTGVNDE